MGQLCVHVWAWSKLNQRGNKHVHKRIMALSLSELLLWVIVLFCSVAFLLPKKTMLLQRNISNILIKMSECHLFLLKITICYPSFPHSVKLQQSDREKGLQCPHSTSYDSKSRLYASWSRHRWSKPMFRSSLDSSSEMTSDIIQALQALTNRLT